jgi:hypothetical protein
MMIEPTQAALNTPMEAKIVEVIFQSTNPVKTSPTSRADTHRLERRCSEVPRQDSR